jgi:hypothetical protein
MDWLIFYCYVPHKNFSLYEDITITGEEQENLGLSSALRAFEQGGIFIVPHLLRHWALVFPVSSESLHLIRLARECGGPILTRILTGLKMK